MTDGQNQNSEDYWYSAEVATFGDRMAAAREFAGMDRESFAIRLGVRANTVTEWEDDLSEPRANRLSMMAGLLNVSVGWLLMGEGDGLVAPDEETPADPSLAGVLAEMREVRGQMRAATERLALLEKRLRIMARGGAG